MNRSVKTLKNAAPDFDIADYPSCELFFPITETTGNILTDLVAGVQTDMTLNKTTAETNGQLAFSGNGALLSGTAGDNYGELSKGVMPNLGNTKHPLLIIAADFTATVGTAVGVGGHTSSTKIQAIGGLFSTVNDGSQFMNAPTIPGSPDVNTEAIACYLDRDAEEFIQIETDGTLVEDAGNRDTVYDANDEIDLGLASGSFYFTSAVKVYATALFNLNSPVTVKEALSIASWCNAEWRSGNKTLPPMLKGR